MCNVLPVTSEAAFGTVFEIMQANYALYLNKFIILFTNVIFPDAICTYNKVIHTCNKLPGFHSDACNSLNHISLTGLTSYTCAYMFLTYCFYILKGNVCCLIIYYSFVLLQNATIENSPESLCVCVSVFGR